MKIKLTDIVWNLENGESDYALPRDIELPEELNDKNNEEVMSWARAEYGYCICSCDFVED